MAAQPGIEEQLDTLVCDGKTLRGSISENASGAARFIAQVSLYSQTLGVAIARTTYASCWRLWSLRGYRQMRCMPTALFPRPRPA
jgi:hypothetical protein